MNFIMLIMFFVTPPNNIPAGKKDTTEDQRVWTLQATSVLDFNTIEQCERSKKEIAEKVDQTNTLKIRAWCIGKGTPSAAISSESVQKQLNEIRPLQ